MEVKEAIKKINYMIFVAELGIDIKIKKEQLNDYIINFKSIISLLQQGEVLKEENEELKAYRQIVGELEENITDKTDLFSNWLRSDIRRLKQKYFPKEGD